VLAAKGEALPKEGVAEAPNNPPLEDVVEAPKDGALDEATG